MANASLVVRVSAQIAEFQKSFKDAAKTASDFADDFEGIATRAAAVGNFFGGIAKDIAQSLASGFAGAIRDAVTFSSQFQNAFLGLSSVARAFGTSTDSATAAAKKLSADGLLPLKDSATGLKNLLATGFSLPQATKLMEAFKDSAAFGRQGALSFGDAVRSATEGVKNGNSILVDNSGITKNLSQILKEAGFSAQDLSRAQTDVGVRTALYNGILKEAAAQQGDAIKLTKTYTGQLTGMKTSWTQLLATWGDAITKNATVSEALGAVRDLFSKFNSVLSDNQRGYNIVSDAIIGFVRVLSGTVRAIDTVQFAFNSLDSAIAGTTLNILQSVKSVADTLLKLIVVAAKLPGSTIVLKAFSGEINSLIAISGLAGPQIASLGERIAANDKRTQSWSLTLTGAATTLDTLADTLAKTRGKTVELGEATGGLANNLGGPSGVDKKAKAATDSLDKLLEKVRELQPLRSGDFWKNVSIPAIPPDLFPSMPAAKLGGIDWNAFWHLNKPTPPPADFWKSADLGTSLGNSILSAIQGGGNIFQAAAGSVGQFFTTGLAKQLTSSVAEGGKAISGFLGGAINAVLPGVGALLGPLVGKIGSALKNAFGLGSAGRDLVKQFADSFGGFDALHKKLDALGASGEALWVKLTQGVGKNNPAEAKAAIDAINDAFGVQSSRLAKAQAVLDEYGITFDQTGEKFRATTIADAFDVLFEKTQTLKDVGVDYSLILEKQASQYSELAKKAIATNTEIPASMRDILQKLSDMGLLVDAATGEFIDLSQVKWAQTLTEGFKSVTDAINKLADALTQGVGGALDQLSQRHVKIPIEFDVQDMPDVPHLAGGGIVTRPTLALIGESGPEAVVPLTRSGMGLDVTSSGGDIYASVYIGNRAIDPHLVRVSRRDARTGGLKTRATSGRSY